MYFICMYTCTTEKGFRVHGTTVLDGREQLNSGPLLEQSVLLNAESFLSPPHTDMHFGVK